jgi:hypothetical protein
VDRNRILAIVLLLVYATGTPAGPLETKVPTEHRDPMPYIISGWEGF